MDSTFSNWSGVVGPKGMTTAQVAYRNGVFARTVEATDWKEEVEREKLSAHDLDSAAAARFVADENVTLTSTMTRLGLAKQV